MADLFKLLPHFEWRGNIYPVTSREVSFTHDGVRHKLQYRDGEIIEQLGSQALTFSYTFPMRDGVTKGPYEQLFSKQLSVLFADIQNRAISILIDPIYGQFNCYPTSYRDSTDVNKRDGTDIAVEFVRTITADEADQAQPTDSLQGLGAEARSLGDDLKLSTGFEQFISPQGKTDIFSAIAGFASQISSDESRIAASASNLSSKLDKLDRALNKLEDPKTARLQESISQLRDSANRVAQHGNNPGKRILTVTKAYAQTIGAASKEAGMTLVDFLKLNPSLVRNPLVPKGSKVKIFG